MSVIFQNFILYLSGNWAAFLTWSLLIGVLVVIRSYQKKWIKEKLAAIKKKHIYSIHSTSKLAKIDTEQLEYLKHNLNIYEDLISEAQIQIVENNNLVDKEVIELLTQLGYQTQGSAKNVE